MPQDKILTNANDVTLIVRYPDGTAEAGPQGRLVVDDFSMSRATDLTGHSGVGNHTPQKISIGDVSFEWEFTVEGEDRQLIENIATEGGVPREMIFTAIARDTRIKLSGAFTDEDTFEGTSGDATEMQISGMATDRTVDAAP